MLYYHNIHMLCLLVVSTNLKKITVVTLEIVPNFRGENKKYLKPQPKCWPFPTWHLSGVQEVIVLIGLAGPRCRVDESLRRNRRTKSFTT